MLCWSLLGFLTVRYSKLLLLQTTSATLELVIRARMIYFLTAYRAAVLEYTFFYCIPFTVLTLLYNSIQIQLGVYFSDISN